MGDTGLEVPQKIPEKPHVMEAEGAKSGAHGFSADEQAKTVRLDDLSPAVREAVLALLRVAEPK
ncbi:MAG: hypothetical protein ACTHLN_11775 [Tepidisphaeraceae bacterium]